MPTGTREEEWVKDQVERCRATVDGLHGALEYIQALPPTKDEARKIVAVNNVTNLLEVAQKLIPKGLTRNHSYAAMMLGRGLTYEEVADVLELPEGESTLHIWRAQSKDFQKLMKYWRDVTLDEQLSMALREIDLLQQDADDEKVRLGLIKLRMDLSARPEDSARWQYEMSLRDREVTAKERDVDRSLPKEIPSWIPPMDEYVNESVIEAEFETEDETTLEDGDL